MEVWRSHISTHAYAPTGGGRHPGFDVALALIALEDGRFVLKLVCGDIWPHPALVFPNDPKPVVHFQDAEGAAASACELLETTHPGFTAWYQGRRG